MAITTTCPGCGAPLQVEEDAAKIVCNFCGTSFKVNLEGVAPALQVSSDQPQYLPEAQPADLQYNPPLTIEGIPQPTPSADDLYNPPIPNASPYEPANVPSPSPIPTQQGYEFPTSQQKTPLTGQRLWITIVVVAIVLIILTCICLVATIPTGIAFW